MAAQINLLPKEKSVGKEAQKAVGILNKIAIGLTGALLLIVVVGGGIYFLMAQRLEALRDEEQTLTNNIQSLQSTEASLILLKDRLQKSQEIISQRTTELALSKQQSILAYDPETVLLDKSEVDRSRSELEIEVASSRNLSGLISHLLTQTTFASLIMTELSFNPALGYKVQFSVN